jgi:hypothetical protein
MIIHPHKSNKHGALLTGKNFARQIGGIFHIENIFKKDEAVNDNIGYATPLSVSYT